MIKNYLFSLTFFCSLSLSAVAQVGIGTNTPDASAQLEVSSGNKGLLIPRVSSTGSVPNPANGLLVYQTGGIPGFYYNSGSAGSPVWLLLSTNSAGAPTGPAGGDLTGTYPNPTLAAGSITAAKLADGSITLGKVNTSGASGGQVLTFNGTNVVWSTPAPAIVADGSITSSKIANNAVITSKVADGAITTDKLAGGSVTLGKVSTLGASSGQVLTFNGTNVVWGTPAPGQATIADGSIINTQIAANAAIAYSKLNLTNSIQNSDITASAVTTSKVADGTITTPKLADGAVSVLKLSGEGASTGQVLTYNGTNVVWSAPSPGQATVADGSVTNTQIAANAAIAYSKLNLVNSIANSDITANAITTSKVANGTVTTSKLADGAVSALKMTALGSTAGQVLTSDGTNVVWATPGASSYGFAANTSNSTIAVVLGGTNVSVPNSQNLSGVTADGSNTNFTIARAGTYRISYAINLTAALLVSTRILINGSAIAASAITPSVSRSNYNAEVIVNVSAGDTVTLQLYGLLAAAVLSSGQGAALTIQQLR